MGLLSLIRAELKSVYLGEGIALRGPRVATALHRLEKKNPVPLGGTRDQEGADERVKFYAISLVSRDRSELKGSKQTKLGDRTSSRNCRR